MNSWGVAWLMRTESEALLNAMPRSRRSPRMAARVLSLSHRRYAEALPTRIVPWRRARSSIRYVSGCGSLVEEAEVRVSRTCVASQPASNARRIDISDNRYTVA